MYVCVVGGANIDISGTPYRELRLRDSNPCVSSISLGGVGRNIAENLARLGVEVVMLTALGTDQYANMIRDNASMVGIDLSHSLVVDQCSTSTYMCINDHHGDMNLAVSDMRILDHLTPEYLASKLDIINGSVCVVADTNIPHCLKYLQDNVNVPLFVDTVSASKTTYISDDLHNIYCIKPNLIETEILAGMSIVSDSDMAKAVDIIHAKGVGWVMSTLGDKGVYYSDGTHQGIIKPYTSNVVNTTGAGDSYVAGVVSSYVNGGDVEQCARQGSAVSSITIADNSTVSVNVNMPNVNKILRGECL